MIRVHYIPTWSGDFRLIRDGDHCRLEVEDPTPAEIERLATFLGKCRGHGWCSKLEGVAETGKSTLELKAGIVEAGRALLGRKEAKDKLDGVITVIRSVDGTLEAEHEEKKAEEAIAKPEADKAVTTKRPTLCCPTPVEVRDVRASEVLRSFCTRQQWEDWTEHGYLYCHGNLSGHTYRVAHRHSPAAIEQGKSARDCTTGCVIHCHDWSVPPAEEVLGIAMTLQFRENWIRNPSGCFGEGPQYHDPFMPDDGQGLDGTDQAALVSSIGRAFREMLGPAELRGPVRERFPLSVRSRRVRVRRVRRGGAPGEQLVDVQ